MIRLTQEAPNPLRPDDLSGDLHRQLIGWIGLAMPWLLILLAIERDGVEVWSRLESISAYYYSGAVALFVGMLASLALFLFTYRGFGNDYHNADRTVAIIAGAAALVVALFPTAAPEDIEPLVWWRPWTGVLHHGAAAVLFFMFAVFALWLFRIDKAGRPQLKGLRNKVYFACGIAILLCIAWAGYNGWKSEPIFLPEAIALIAFSFSWLVKGYADAPLRAMLNAR